MNIFIWGAGEKAAIVYEAINTSECNILGIIDIDEQKQGKLWNDKLHIYEPSVIDKTDFDYIVISPLEYTPIKEYIISLGVKVKKIVCFWENNIEREGTIFDYGKCIKYLEGERIIYKNRYYNMPYEMGIMKAPVIVDQESTLKLIIKEKKSLSRFGDGEFDLMFEKKRSWFQKPDRKFAERLLEVFTSNNPNIIIAVADNFSCLDKYTVDAADAIRDYMVKSRSKIESIIDYSKTYHDTYVTRPYIIYKEKSHADRIFQLFKQIWDGKNVILVEGNYSRIGVGNDFMNNAKSIKRILCPQYDCWFKYDEILKNTMKYAKKEDIICISLGATASVLAYDLAKEGFWAIDIGQVDNEYEWYIRKSDNRVSIPGKMVAEVGRTVPDCIDISDNQEYLTSIIDEIK
jgi:glycosyltransferase family protein